jgi:hypothetical protein
MYYLQIYSPDKIQQLNILRERDIQELKQLKDDYNNLEKKV